MSALGGPLGGTVGALPPSFPTPSRGVNALSAPFTPGNRMAVVDRSKADPEVVQAAEGMEGIFLDYMLKVMRETVPKNDMDLESPATGIYRGMMDSEYVKKAVHSGGIGLADQIIAYLESQRYTGPQGQRSPNSRSTGGTSDEGRPDRK